MTLREKLLLAISEHHSGNAKEGGRIADAVLALLSSLVEDEKTVERVARGIGLEEGAKFDNPSDMTGLSLDYWQAWKPSARAALRALTEEK